MAEQYSIICMYPASLYIHLPVDTQVVFMFGAIVNSMVMNIGYIYLLQLHFCLDIHPEWDYWILCNSLFILESIR